MFMNVSALTMKEAEIMLRAIDKWLRRFYGIYAHRRTSFNRRANDGIRAQISVDVPEEAWDRIGDIIAYEAYLNLGKWVTYNKFTIGQITIVDFCTEEAEI